MKKKTILVAEDEVLNSFYIETLIKKTGKGYNIIHAKNGQEAVEHCMQNSEIDLVLMDIKMPKMNGHEATQKIKASLPDLPIIAQTAYSGQSDMDKALQFGCDDFISKPIVETKLLKLIEKYSPL